MPNDEVPLAPKKEQQDSLEENVLPSTDSSTVQFKEGGARGWATALGGYGTSEPSSSTGILADDRP